MIDNSIQKNFLSTYLFPLINAIIRIITDLRLAIILLLMIAFFSILGTVIDQNQSLAFYQENYPESPALFGFLTWQILIKLELNHVYTAGWFLAILVLFGSSLIICTFKRQLPALKAVKLWKFYRKSEQFNKLAFSTYINNTNIENIKPYLLEKGYKIFDDTNVIYASKGILGKVGPIIVHVGMIVILVGSIWGAFTGFFAQEMIASGDTFQVKNIFEAGILSSPKKLNNFAIKVNNFWIKYTPQGKVDQFYSDLSIVNENQEELKRKTIFVNQPLRYKGVTFYQTNWGISSVKVQINNSPIFNLPMAELNTENNGRLWGTWVPTKPDLSAGVALIAKDLQGTMFLYDANGNLVNAVRPKMPIEVNGVTLKIIDLIGSTGLQIKSDPGVPIVYLGFALLMIGVVFSYISYSQIWVLQVDQNVFFGGKTNRSQVIFERELLTILNQIKV